MRGANEVITVWNRWHDDVIRQDIWMPHVVEGCVWMASGGRRTAGANASAEDRVTVMIGALDGYKPPHVWRALQESERETFFTVREGDVVARGDMCEQWRLSGDVGDRISDLREALGRDMCVVTRVADFSSEDRRGGHLVVVGR